MTTFGPSSGPSSRVAGLRRPHDPAQGEHVRPAARRGRSRARSRRPAHRPARRPCRSAPAAPSRMIRIRSPSLSASDRSWVMKTIVLPTSWCSRMTSFCMSRRISGSSAENGSSKSRIVRVDGQRPGQADALLHAAGELVGVGVLVARQARPARSPRRPSCSRSALPDAADLQAVGHVVDDPAVRQQAEVLEDHGELVPAQLAQPLLVGLAGCPRPRRRPAPAVGSISRVRQRTSVDLPEPDRPMTTNTSPGATSKRHVAHGRGAAGLAP